MVVETAGMFC